MVRVMAKITPRTSAWIVGRPTTEGSGRSELSGTSKCCDQEEGMWKRSLSEMVGIETAVRERYLGSLARTFNPLKKNKEELVLSEGGWGTEDVSENVQEWLRHRDDGTVQVHIDSQWHSCQGLDEVCKEGCAGEQGYANLDKESDWEDLPVGACGGRSKECVVFSEV